MNTCHASFLACALVVVAPSAVWAESEEENRGPYLRLGAGMQWPESSDLKDKSCSSSNPPALFGCGRGDDGRSLGAYGGFDQAPVVDAAVGYRWTSWLRTEALLNWSPQLSMSSTSNFLGRGSNQPVSAFGNALAGFGVFYVDGPELATARPYIGAGLGAASTSLGQVTYRIPAISSDAVTVTSGGRSTSFAYLLTAGVSIPVSERLDLDLAYRWTDLGTAKTNAGPAKIVRPAGRSNLKIAGTQIDLQSQAVLASLRFRF
jgi:opacity protein-like surface antigen